jgi:hypothetical protein
LKELLLSLDTIREKSKDYGDWLTGIDPKYPDSFAMIFNDTTLTLEMLDYYYGIWKRKRLLPTDVIKRLREENAQRVLGITKWAFISALSIIEYTAKEMLKMANTNSFEYLRAKLQSGKRVHLSEIIERSKKITLIDVEQYETWRALIEVRNAVVHNNAIADIDGGYKIDDIEITLVKGKMLRDKLNFFIKLLGITTDQYYKWLRALLG